MIGNIHRKFKLIKLEVCRLCGKNSNIKAQKTNISDKVETVIYFYFIFLFIMISYTKYRSKKNKQAKKQIISLNTPQFNFLNETIPGFTFTHCLTKYSNNFYVTVRPVICNYFRSHCLIILSE